MAKKAEKLTPKQERFCQEYMIDLNGARAYEKAYGCSIKAAESGASRMLTVAKVKLRLDKLKAKVLESNDMTARKVVAMIVDTHRRAKLAGDEFAAENKASDMLMKHVGGYEKDNKIGLDAETITLLGLIDGRTKGKLPDRQEDQDAGQ